MLPPVSSGNLTWRDVQYLLAYTARKEGLGTPQHWTANGAGLLVSQEYGFGAVDAEALVSRARHWTAVPVQHSCSVHHLLRGNRLELTLQDHANLLIFPSRFLTAGHSMHLVFNVSHINCAVSVLEHVVLRVKLEMGGAYRPYSYSDYISHSNEDTLIDHCDVRRGDVTIDIVSPFGTISQLLPRRPKDFVNTKGFDYWPFMSVRHWGEFSRGLWVVNISYSPRKHTQGYALLQALELNLFGTFEVPESVLGVPSVCDQHCFGACGGEGPFMCDVCKSKRNAWTLQCVDSCSEGSGVQGSYCFPPANSSLPSSMMPSTEPWQIVDDHEQMPNLVNAASYFSITNFTIIVLCALLLISNKP